MKSLTLEGSLVGVLGCTVGVRCNMKNLNAQSGVKVLTLNLVMLN